MVLVRQRHGLPIGIHAIKHNQTFLAVVVFMALSIRVMTKHPALVADSGHDPFSRWIAVVTVVINNGAFLWNLGTGAPTAADDLASHGT